MDPLELTDDDLVAVVSNMGASLVGRERLTDPRTSTRAVTMLEEYPRRPRARQARDGSARRGTRRQRAPWDALRTVSI
jgi:hypothetical protein